MTPYELLEELRKGIIQKVFGEVQTLKDLTKETITKAEHLKEINRIIETLKDALDVSEYEFQFVNNKNEIVDMEGHQINLKTLQDNNTIIFQPLEMLSENILDVDLESLQDAMMQLAESTGANVIMLPPSINVMVAKLKKNGDSDVDKHVQQD